MTKKRKHLNFYYKCMKTGKLPNGQGLCKEAIEQEISEELLDLIDPEQLGAYEFDNFNDLYVGISTTYWGAGSKNWRMGEFTPLRQTIVLLMAAMNGEL